MLIDKKSLTLSEVACNLVRFPWLGSTWFFEN